MKKILSNEDIYNYTNLLMNNFFKEDIEISLPVEVNFYIQKNFRILMEASKDIEQTKQTIAKKYGKMLEDGSYIIDKDKIEEAQEALEKLFEIEQSINIATIPLEDIKGLQLTIKQMQALYFMIDA